MKKYNITFLVNGQKITVDGYGHDRIQAIWDARMSNYSIKYGEVVAINCIGYAAQVNR